MVLPGFVLNEMTEAPWKITCTFRARAVSSTIIDPLMGRPFRHERSTESPPRTLRPVKLPVFHADGKAGRSVMVKASLSEGTSGACKRAFCRRSVK